MWEDEPFNDRGCGLEHTSPGILIVVQPPGRELVDQLPSHLVDIESKFLGGLCNGGLAAILSYCSAKQMPCTDH